MKVKAVIRFKGGPGSGNFGHSGRPGHVGGSGGGRSARIYEMRRGQGTFGKFARATDPDLITRIVLDRKAERIADEESRQVAIEDSRLAAHDEVIFYHGTTGELLDTVLKEGLTAQPAKYHNETDAQYNSVFATPDITEAQKYGLRGSNAVNGTAVVFKIAVPKGAQYEPDPEAPGAFRFTKGHIPSEWIVGYDLSSGSKEGWASYDIKKEKLNMMYSPVVAIT